MVRVRVSFKKSVLITFGNIFRKSDIVDVTSRFQQMSLDQCGRLFYISAHLNNWNLIYQGSAPFTVKNWLDTSTPYFFCKITNNSINLINYLPFQMNSEGCCGGSCPMWRVLFAQPLFHCSSGSRVLYFFDKWKARLAIVREKTRPGPGVTF